MSKRRTWWLAVLGALVLQAGVRAEGPGWQPVLPAPPGGDLSLVPAAAASLSPSQSRATLGAPQPIDGPESPPYTPVTLSDLSPVVHTESPPPGAPTLSVPSLGGSPSQVTCGQPAPPPAEGAYNEGVVVGQPLGHSFWGRCKDVFCGGERCSQSGRCPFQSDHCFDALASPVTNPFFFEDPRALTEVRPIFIYQGAPSTNPIFRGGNSEFYGTQARLALTERWSLVLNELGFVSMNPNNPIDGFSKSTGFAQVMLGPKYTFLRLPNCGSVMAGGVNFWIPAGSSTVFQNVGTLSLVPYLSYGQVFGQWPRGWGSFNFIGNTGYSFSVDRQRSEFYYLNAHLDYNILNLNHFYPFLEMNYFYYSRPGRANDFGFEGADLANFGSVHVGSRNFWLVSPGIRLKLNEHVQTGIAISWPVLNQKQLTDYRLTLDLIFRY